MTAKVKAARAHYANVAEKAPGIIEVISDYEGQYAGKCFQEEALECGWSKRRAILNIEREWHHEATDEAIEWMNSNIAPEGWSFDFMEGGIWFSSYKGYSGDGEGWSEDKYTEAIKFDSHIKNLTDMMEEAGVERAAAINEALTMLLVFIQPNNEE